MRGVDYQTTQKAALIIAPISGVFVDSCVLLDLFTDDPNWVEQKK
jgi:hypothetical protein